MRKSLLLVSFILLRYVSVNAQAPQFAVVRPDGTTYICPTWDSAYNKAINGDNIYLPGVPINIELTIDKRLTIFGAGHHPDSSNAVGVTTVNGRIFLSSGASGGKIEGLQITSDIYLNYTGRKIRDITIKRCRFPSLQFINGGLPADSLPTNIAITENVFSSSNGYGSSGIAVSKNLISNGVYNLVASDISNNNFINPDNFYLYTLTYCTVSNNIWLSVNHYQTACTNTYSNNLKIAGQTLLNGCPINTGVENNTISVASATDIFVSYTPGNAGFPYLDNYHLKPTCPGKNAGTDGTDVGIYGTSQPTSEGWVPSNPHIYFKQVAPQTNSSGQLQIQFKVRTNN